MAILIVYAISAAIVAMSMLAGFLSYRFLKAFFIRRSTDRDYFAYSSANIKATWLSILVAVVSVWILTAVSLGLTWPINVISK